MIRAARGFMSKVFTFVDASHLIAKAALWEERDEILRQKYEKLNNETLPKVAHDKEARIGCKGKNKFWYGFKKHVSVDIQSGLINKVAITPANLTDAGGFKHVCPNSDAVFADKGYCAKPAKQAVKNKCVHLAAIKKNNMEGKNRDLDRRPLHNSPKKSIKDGIIHKAKRNQPLRYSQKKFNRLISEKRFKIEQGFGTLKRRFRFNRVSYMTQIKVEAQLRFKSICFNLLKAVNMVKFA